MKSMPVLLIRCAAAMVLATVLSPSFSCRYGSRLARETLPVDNATVEVQHATTARVRSMYCDVMAAPVDETLWERLIKAGSYRSSAGQHLSRRPLPATAFLVMIKNTVNAPVKLDKAQIISGTAVSGSMTADQARKRFTSPAYAWCDFDKLLSLRRVVVETESLKSINIDRDTIETKLSFIPSRDSEVAVLLFEALPVEIRTFTLRITISTMGGVRDMDIDFMRHDYRSEKLKKRNDEEIIDDAE